MAISVAWQTVVTNITSTTSLFTTPSSTAATYAYGRDLVITNSGASTLFVSGGTGTTAATTLISFGIPSGGTLLLTQCQVPGATIIWGTSGGTAAASIGWATNVAYI